MANEAIGVCAGGFCVIIILLVLSSWTSLSATEMALKYDYVFKTVSPEVVDLPGLKFIGPTKQLIRYPKTILTLEYTQEHREILDGRTSDGLPLILGVAFQYRLLPDELFQLYQDYENNVGDYENIFKLVGIHLITEQATNHTAYEFFNEKQKIAAEMKETLDKYFRANLHATVESLQIQEDDLPGAFTQTILTAATTKQNITKMQKLLEAKKIEYETAIIVAKAQANVTIQKAVGENYSIQQNGIADAQVIESYVDAEITSYKKVKEEMGLEGEDLINYIWYDTLAGGSVSSDQQQAKDSTILVGVSPSAYISQYKS